MSCSQKWVVVALDGFGNLAAIGNQGLGEAGGLHRPPPFFRREPVFFHVSGVLRFRRAGAGNVRLQVKRCAAGQREFALLHGVVAASPTDTTLPWSSWAITVAASRTKTARHSEAGFSCSLFCQGGKKLPCFARVVGLVVDGRIGLLQPAAFMQ